MEYYTLWQIAKHLHREVILLEDFFKSLLKKFFTLCCWHKSTVFKIWKIFVIQFYFDLSTQRAAKITNSIRKRLKVEVSTNFKCQICGLIFQVYLNTLKYYTYSHWSHLQLYQEHLQIVFQLHQGEHAGKEQSVNNFEKSGLCSLNNITQKHRKKTLSESSLP